MKTFWFPPRLVTVQEDDPNDMLDTATDLYLNEGVAICIDESHVQDAYKIINFAKQFPQM